MINFNTTMKYKIMTNNINDCINELNQLFITLL